MDKKKHPSYHTTTVRHFHFCRVNHYLNQELCRISHRLQRTHRSYIQTIIVDMYWCGGGLGEMFVNMAQSPCSFATLSVHFTPRFPPLRSGPRGLNPLRGFVNPLFRLLNVKKSTLNGCIFLCIGGGGGIRTPVRKQRYISISERSHSFRFRSRIRGVTR